MIIFTKKNLLKITLTRFFFKHTGRKDKLRETEVKRKLLKLNVKEKKELKDSKDFFPTNN